MVSFAEVSNNQLLLTQPITYPTLHLTMGSLTANDRDFLTSPTTPRVLVANVIHFDEIKFKINKKKNILASHIT